MFDLTYQFDPDRVCLCPICDQPMFTYEAVTTIVVDDCQCMAHNFCAINFNEEEDDED